DIDCWAAGGIILSSVATRYQVGLLLHAGSVTAPLSAATPQGTWEFAMNSALSLGRSPANASGNFPLSSRRNPSWGWRIGGTGAPGAGSLISAAADSPRPVATAAMETRVATRGSVPASVMTTPPYEWPTRTTGDFCSAMTRLVAATSS